MTCGPPQSVLLCEMVNGRGFRFPGDGSRQLFRLPEWFRHVLAGGGRVGNQTSVVDDSAHCAELRLVLCRASRHFFAGKFVKVGPIQTIKGRINREEA